MRIGFNFHSIDGNISGVEHYSLGLLRSLLDIDKANEYIVFTNSPNLIESHIGLRDNLTVRDCSFLKNRLHRILWEHLRLPILAKKEKLDILHCPHYICPVMRSSAAYVATIHDTIAIDHSSWCKKANAIYYRLFLAKSVKIASKIIAVSKFTAEKINKNFGTDSSKTEVIHPGVDTYIFNLDIDNQKQNQVRTKYNLPKDYILYAGNIEPKKNLLSLLKAFKQLKTDGTKHSLVITGRRNWKSKHVFDFLHKEFKPDEVILTGYIDRDDIGYVYKMADCLVLPSLCEGFGFPAIEAFACGIPVAASKVGILQEINPNTYSLLEPDNIDQIFKETDRCGPAGRTYCFGMGEGKFAARPVIEVFVINTLAGGTGSSSYARAMTIIKQLGDELKIDLKITPLSAILGTLNPGNKPLAAINQQSALKNMLARLEAGFTDLDQTDGDLRAVSNPPIFMSNANNFGELADLNRTSAKIAYSLYLLAFTGFGAIARQDCVDHYNSTTLDQYGTLRKGASLGISNISFTRQKLIESAAFDYAENLISHILRPDRTSDIERMTEILLSNLSLQETHSQAMTVDRALSSDKSAYSAVDRVISVFRDRCSKRWGFAGCRDIMFASNYARQNELQGRMLHMVEDNIQQWLGANVKAIAAEIKGHLTRINGISTSRQLLEKISESITELDKKNDKGLFIARKNDKNVKSNLKHYENIYNKLAKRMWILRALSFADKDTFKKSYPAVVESDIRNTLQIHARTLLKEIVFPKIKALIADLIEHISKIENVISDLDSYYASNVTRLNNLPSYLYDAGGYELIDEKFINESISRFYNELGGRESASKKAFELFIGKFKNLDSFVTTGPDRIGAFIKDSGVLNAKNCFHELNVYDVFNKFFFTDKQKTEIVSSIIERSSFSVKITGEGDENVPKVKYICGNDVRLVNWAVKKANEIDRKGGDWKGHINERLPEGLSFFQYRTNISIAQLMKDTSVIASLPTELSERVRMGENPVISIMPEPGVNEDGQIDSRFDRVIAQGIACGAVVCNPDGFELHKPYEEPKIIGTTIEDIRKYLAGNFASVVCISRKFAQSMLNDGSDAIGVLRNGDLPGQLDKEAAQDALNTAALLMPYVSRIK